MQTGNLRDGNTSKCGEMGTQMDCNQLRQRTTSITKMRSGYDWASKKYISCLVHAYFIHTVQTHIGYWQLLLCVTVSCEGGHRGQSTACLCVCLSRRKQWRETHAVSPPVTTFSSSPTVLALHSVSPVFPSIPLLLLLVLSHNPLPLCCLPPLLLTPTPLGQLVKHVS